MIIVGPSEQSVYRCTNLAFCIMVFYVALVSGDAAVAERLPARYRHGDVY